MPTSRRDRSGLLRHYARRMRSNPSDAERKLWRFLQDRKLGGFKFRRQVPIAGFIVDFYCEQASLAVEVDGDQHGSPEAMEYDNERTRALGELRIRVVRFTARDTVKDPEAVARTILRFITEGW